MNRHLWLRVTRSCLTSLLLVMVTWYYSIPERAWSLITVWIVTLEYNTIGGVFTKSLLRFYGTLLSGVYAIGIIYFGGNNALINLLAILPGAYVFTYYFLDKENAYIGIIGIITLCIVLLNYYRIDLALFRIFNVLLGIIGAVFMTFVFYPQYARDNVVEIQLNLLRLFCKMLKNCLDSTQSIENSKERQLDIEQEMLDGFLLFQRTLNEAKIETKKTPLYIIHHQQAHQHMRRLFRSLCVYLSCYTPEQMRSDQNLQQLRYTFEEVIKALKVPLSDEVATPPPLNEKTDFVDILFRNINNELRVYRCEMMKVLSIYQQYYVRS